MYKIKVNEVGVGTWVASVFDKNGKFVFKTRHCETPSTASFEASVELKHKKK